MTTLQKCIRCGHEIYRRDGSVSTRCPACHALNASQEPAQQWGWLNAFLWLLAAMVIYAAFASNPPPGGTYYEVAPSKSEPHGSPR